MYRPGLAQLQQQQAAPSIKDQLFSGRNGQMLQTVLLQDFQERQGTELTEPPMQHTNVQKKANGVEYHAPLASMTGGGGLAGEGPGPPIQVPKKCPSCGSLGRAFGRTPHLWTGAPRPGGG